MKGQIELRIMRRTTKMVKLLIISGVHAFVLLTTKDPPSVKTPLILSHPFVAFTTHTSEPFERLTHQEGFMRSHGPTSHHEAAKKQAVTYHMMVIFAEAMLTGLGSV